jgi:ATP-dependent RNA helicase DeaD
MHGGMQKECSNVGQVCYGFSTRRAAGTISIPPFTHRKANTLPFPHTVEPLSRALTERSYNDPTPVQLAVLQDDAAGRDLVVSAQTGSGKTVAYGLAIAKTLLGDAASFHHEASPVALIVAPTRELAMQVERELRWLYFYTGARILSCVGGMDPKRERRQLNDGAHIIVGTPGRLRDHLERGVLDIKALKAVVLDEADEMLDLGFREDIEFILEATPAERRTLLFSATMPKPIAMLAKKYQKNALRIETLGESRAHADIEYRAMRVAPNEVEHAVVNVLRFVEPQSAIVFCNTREHVKHLHATLSERGFAAVNLSGELSQSERNHALQALRDGRARVCVATDVAARGIDLPNLGLVIHADLPNDAEVLQHRSGRTGRAGKKGVSAVLVPLSRRRKAERLLHEAGVSPSWSGVPQAEDIRKLDQQRMMQDPILTAPTTEEDLEMARAVLATRTPEDIAAALVRVYRSRLPAAEDVFDPGPGNERDSFKQSKRFERDSGPRDFTWFRMDIGRKNNADPKWLLPMICRRGKVTKPDIGAIRITDNETRFEIANTVVARFLDASKVEADDDVKIEQMAGAPEPPPDHRPFKKKFDGPRKSFGDKKHFGGKKPFGAKPRFDKSQSEGAYEDRKPYAEGGKGKSAKSFDKTRKPKYDPLNNDKSQKGKKGLSEYERALKEMLATGKTPPRKEKPEWRKR